VKRQHGFFAGNARIAALPSATSAEFGAFLKENVMAQSHLLTDGFASYRGRDAALGEHLKHTPVVQDEMPMPASSSRSSIRCSATSKPGSSVPITASASSTCRAIFGKGPTGSIAAILPDGLDGYLIRRALECATITYDQLKTGAMSGGANRVWRVPAEIVQPALAR
jgi:hypothetical protein